MRRLLPTFLFLLFAPSLLAQQQPQLSITIDVGDRLSSDSLADVRFNIENISDLGGTNVFLDMFLGNGSAVTAMTSSDPTTDCPTINIGGSFRYDPAACIRP